ncbi:hypothetical protein SDC9_89740 [bioreactor metagenome]|uniref:Uncharacterized protein n=1 Tax=bioreactor metagenome TaxID=1076179 RepID=A0A644ZQN3_9ZZZZ
MDEVVSPVLQTNDVAGRSETTERLVASPKQIADEVALTVSTGFGKTLTVTDPVVTHPCGLVTVTS